MSFPDWFCTIVPLGAYTEKTTADVPLLPALDFVQVNTLVAVFPERIRISPDHATAYTVPAAGYMMLYSCCNPVKNVQSLDSLHAKYYGILKNRT